MLRGIGAEEAQGSGTQVRVTRRGGDEGEGGEDNEGMTASDDEELEQRRHRAQELR